MRSKMQTYFLLLSLIAGIKLSHAETIYWQNRVTTLDCSDGIGGFCGDCFTEVLCNTDGTFAEFGCSDGNACVENGDLTACVSDSEVEECSCPGSGLIKVPDKYDNQKFIQWVNCQGFIETCPDNQFVDPNTNTCVEGEPTDPQSTTPPPSTGEECEDAFEMKAINCTAYRFCFSNGEESDPISCEKGQLFDRDLDQCIDYQPFSCDPSAPDDYYGDPLDCSTFYTCVDGEQVGDNKTCGNEQFFDVDSHRCAEDGKCGTIKDCGICSDDTTTWAVNTDCVRFFQCMKSSDDTLTYVPVLRQCPDNFYYDSEGGFCTPDKPSNCPQ